MISSILDEMLDFLSSECFKRRVKVERSYEDEQLMILADSRQLRQVFLNLILNSLDAMDGCEGGTLSVSTWQRDSYLLLAIADTGFGIPREHLEHIFDPFFTTKSNGTGLGLSIVRDIITEHNGTITFDSVVGVGTRCTLRFPLCRSSKATPESVGYQQ